MITPVAYRKLYSYLTPPTTYHVAPPKRGHFRSKSLVVNDVEFGKSGKLGGATSITSITKGNENGTAQQEVVQNGIGGGTLGRVASWALGLDKLLKDPAGIATFTEFLKKEFSEENIVFWTECEKLKKVADLNERKRKAKELYDKHIAVSGSEPVNVDSHARQRALETLNDPKPSFEVSQTQIFTLMKTDSYPRFLKSDVYKESVLAEMENKPLPFTGVEEDKSKDDVKKVDFLETSNSSINSQHGNKGWMIQMLKKSRSVTSSNSEEGDREEKRRKSLLPWARKWGGFGNHRGKPPLPRSKSVTSEDRLETTEITGKEPVISDMLGSEHLPQFDELGVLDPEKKSEERGKGSTSTDDHRTSGIFSFIRRNSFGEKDARTKAKTRSNSQGAAPSHATDTAAPVQQLVHPPSSRGQQLQHAGVAPPTRRGGKDPEQERFFELLTKVQSHRLDDQRGLTAADLELPDFLKVNQKGHSRSSLSSQSSMPGAKRYRRHERRNSDSSLMDISPDSSRLSRSYSQDKMETDTRSVNSYESPSTNRIPYMDQSFSQEGVYPSHRDADTLFSGEHHSITQTPNYNDSRLMDKSLGDLGFGQNGSAIKGTTPLNKLPTRLSPHSKSASNSRVSVPPRMSRPDSRTSTQQERTVDPHSQTNQDSGRSRTSRAIGSPRGAQMRSVSVDRVMLQQQRVQSHSNHSNNANCNHQYHGGNHSNDQEMIPVATPSPTTHDLILAPDSSPEISSNVPHHHQNQPQSHQQSHPHSLKNGHANGHNHGPRPQPPPRTPRRSPRQTAPPQTPPHPDQPVKKTLVFEEEIPEVQISQVSYV